MNTAQLFDPDRRSKAPFVFILCLLILIGAVVLASWTQKGFGTIDVSNITYTNFNGILVRAKLLKPLSASTSSPAPGIVYIHGYQNNRETSDAYCIELARRGVAVLEIDAIGRGNSGIPGQLDDPDFDPTYGGKTSLAYLKSLPFVDTHQIGLMGHSLGAEMVYTMAVKDPSIAVLVISGFAYREDASTTLPKNMLMIFGKYDEFRQRMTGTRDFEKEWMGTELTRNVFAVENPELSKTYGDFKAGTARRVFMPKITHLHTSHSSAAVAEALQWIKQAFDLPAEKWIPADNQIWQIKEWSTLVAMVACLACLLPLGLILLRASFFRSLHFPISPNYSCSGKACIKPAIINGVLMWLYFPIIFVLFGIHVYLVPIDRVFPLMMTNGVVWWFLWLNIIGFFFFRRWFKRQRRENGLTLFELGLSNQEDRFNLSGSFIAKTILLGAILVLFAYLSEHTLENFFLVDFRFIFPFASDLTPYRAQLWFTYFPLLLVGFLLMGVFLHGQLRRPLHPTWFKTFISWSGFNILVLVLPLVLLLWVQYIPLFINGAIPLVGPGGMLIAFTHNLFHIIAVLILVIPISTWFYQLTGRIYLGAIVNAGIVAWMFVSSQVIAPIPV
ncbi:MAG: alpha/beta hydrolase [Desulfobacteraceae bacterium]|jgi:pimeloyl-ACP methyl ester carboxylesterase|nr:alpha/beta hydrolase [Desulfobacteraceae bacterium]